MRTRKKNLYRRKSLLYFMVVLMVMSIFPFHLVKASDLTSEDLVTEETDDDTLDDDNPENNDAQNDCQKTEGCTLKEGHEGDCVLSSGDDADQEQTDGDEESDDPNDEDKTKCEKSEECVLVAEHEGSCQKEDGTLIEATQEELVEEELCDLTDGCILEKGHEGDCKTEKEAEDDTEKISSQETDLSSVSVTAASDISAYFGETLGAKISVTCPVGADNYFYLKLDTDRAGLVGEDTFNVTDSNGEEITITKTEDGCCFVLDNDTEGASTDFMLTFASEEEADSTVSNPATVKIYTGTGLDQESAKGAAATVAEEDEPALTLTWSASSDKLQYEISLQWKSDDENTKYVQHIDTVGKSSLEVSYVLNITTSTGTYETGKMEVRIPYALWVYRSGTEACVPSDISLPMAPSTGSDDNVKYHYTVDDKGTEDLGDDELVITNWCEVMGGTNTTIEVKYTIDPVKTVDMSKAELTARGSATSTLQETPEEYTSDTITYQLDTGVNYKGLFKDNDRIEYLYSEDSYCQIADEDWDFENYHYVRWVVSDEIYVQNQGVKKVFTFEDALCEDAEVIYVKIAGSGNSLNPILEGNIWTLNWPSDTYNYTSYNYIYVRYPVSQKQFNPTISVEVIAEDEDSHSEEDGDHNDLYMKRLSLGSYEWKAYEYHVGELERWRKYKYTGGNTFVGGIEVLKEGKSPGAFSWQLEQSYDGNLLAEGAKQKLEIYDDYHFWTALSSSGSSAWMPMTEGDYEITGLSSLKLYYSAVSFNSGKSIYPDFAGGEIVVEGYRNGAWESVGTVEVAAQTNRKSSELFHSQYSGNYQKLKAVSDTLKGKGYTRIRIRTPEVGRGKIELKVSVSSEIKPDSPNFKEWVEAFPNASSQTIYNYAAYKHYSTNEDGEFAWDDKQGSQVTVYYNGETSAYKPPSAIETWLKQLDQAENNYEAEGSGWYMLRDYETASLSGISYGSEMVNKATSITNNVDQQRVDVKFTIKEAEASNMSYSFANMYPEIRNGLIQTEGTFYDLLPEGYYYNTESEPEAFLFANSSNAIIDDVQVIDNWDGTGRQMVIFRVKVPEGYTNLKSGYLFDTNGGIKLSNLYSTLYNGYEYESGFTISFDTCIKWKDLAYTSGKSVNLTAFQTDRTIKGTTNKGCYARSDAGTPGESASSQFEKEFQNVVGRDGKPAFYDIDGDGVIEFYSTLYSYSEVSVDVATALEVGIDTRVKGQGGVYTTEDATAVGDTYKYRVGVTNSEEGTVKDLIVYDILEEAANKDGGSNEVSWKGVFQSIDTSKAEALGVKPVIYYSTQKLDYNTQTGVGENIWIEDTSVWTTTMPKDKSAITAVAVDFRKKADGTDFILPNSGGVYFEISMKAPNTQPQTEDPDKVYAFNRGAYYCYRETLTSSEGSYAMTIGNRVRISIPETQITVVKKWEDAEDRDRKRPDSVQVQLFANEKAYGNPVTLKADNNWSYTWEHLSKLAVNSGEIDYSVKEVTLPDGYSAAIEKDGTTITITNSYTPETIFVQGEKIWVDNQNEKGKRPESITVRLIGSATGEGSWEAGSKKVTADDEWKWKFTDIPKYKNGKKITYTVLEDTVAGYRTVIEGDMENGFTIINTPKSEPAPTPETPAPTGTPEPTQTPVPVVTPTPSGTPNPDTTPTPTLETPTPESTPGTTQTPEPVSEITPVNGARIEASGTQAAVLGVRRTTDCAVLGKRRRPGTGDSPEMMIWLFMMLVSVGAAATAGTALYKQKKKREI